MLPVDQLPLQTRGDYASPVAAMHHKSDRAPSRGRANTFSPDMDYRFKHQR